VAHLVDVFREVRRVLRPDGLCFVNISDSYAGSGKGPTGHNGIGDQNQRQGFTNQASRGRPKSLHLVPERLAIALADDGWIVRSRIAWIKKAPMPESVRDRPTSAWEHIWMLAKGQRYYWDSVAVAEKSLDHDAMREVQYSHGNEDLHDLFTDAPIDSVLSKQERAESRGDVQAMRGCPHQGMAQDTIGRGVSLAGNTEVQRQPGGQDEEGKLSGLRSESGISAQVRSEREGQSGCSSIPSDREVPRESSTLLPREPRQGSAAPLAPDAEGPRVPIEGRTQAPLAPGQPIDAISSGLANDSGSLRACLCLLRTDGIGPDERSHPATVDGRPARAGEHPPSMPKLQLEEEQSASGTRNPRNYLLLGPEPYKNAHFATFPTAIPDFAIRASTSERGACASCGAPWARVVERTRGPIAEHFNPKNEAKLAAGLHSRKTGLRQPGWRNAPNASTETMGWTPTCRCQTDAPPVPCVVLDPFSGAGTSVMVAKRLGRRGIGLELNGEYANLSKIRILGDSPLFNGAFDWGEEAVG
jgi:hypothetical protein